MKAVIYLFKSIWDMFSEIPFFDTGISFGTFIIALCLFDILIIILRTVLRKRSQDSNSSPNAKGSEN